MNFMIQTISQTLKPHVNKKHFENFSFIIMTDEVHYLSPIATNKETHATKYTFLYYSQQYILDDLPEI